MSNIDPPASWADVDGINTNERLLGGPEGPLNRAVTGLTARTKQLRDDTTNAAGALAAVTGSSLVGFSSGVAGSTAQTVQAVLRERISVKTFGAVLDGVADDTSAFVAAFAYGAATGAEILVPAGTAKITSGLVVSCHVHHVGEVKYKFTLGSTQDAVTLFASNSIVSRCSFTGTVELDGQGTGRDGLRLRKFEGADLGLIRVTNFPRAGVCVAPEASFDWMENLTARYVKVDGCLNGLRVYIPNLTGVFANLFVWSSFEIRNVSGLAVDVIFDGTTTQGQSCAEWAFGTFEIDTGQTNAGPNADYLLSATRINGAVASVAQSWNIQSLVIENTRASDPKIHTYGFYCNGTTNLWNNLDCLADRFQVSAGLSPIVAQALGRVNYRESGRIDTSGTGNYSAIQRGGTLSDRLVLDNSLSVRAGATTDLIGPTTITGLSRIVTQYGGADSTYAAGEAKNVYQIGVDVGTTTSYEVHRLRILPQNATTANYNEFLVLCGPGATIQVLRTIGTRFSASIAGGYVVITNTELTGFTVRHVRTREV